MRENKYESPQAELVEDVEVDESLKSKIEPNNFAKIRFMNGIAGILWLILLAVGILNSYKSNVDENRFVLLLFAIFCVFIVSAPVTTFFALSNPSRRLMLNASYFINWTMIVLFIISAIGTISAAYHLPDQTGKMLFPLIPSFLFFVVPQAINIRALSKIRKFRVPNKSSHSAS